MPRFPLVSCLCVTKNDLKILKRSIDCFRGQTYPNKELIILKQGTDPYIANYVNTLNDKRIRFIEVPALPRLSLGELRNLSVESCKGEYFCVWDDDDWQHVSRLKIQVTAMIDSLHPVSALTNLLAFNDLSKRAYFTTFRLWEGTILCKRELFMEGIKYPSLAKSEDNHLLKILHQSSKIYPVVCSVLYVYVYHGNNTWDIDHFNNNIFGQNLSSKASKVVAKVLKAGTSSEQGSNLLDSSSIPSEVNHFYGTFV